jgi:TM2 domain-containing membrane protein YozV
MAEQNNTNDGYDSTKKRLDDAADNFEEGAKKTANEFKESWNEVTNNNENKKMLAGLLGIFLGWLGVHKFILGYNTEGIILLVLGVLGFFTCGITSAISGIIGLIEGIIYLTKTDNEFYTTYQLNKKSWF